jgi:hypothetical protein
MKRALVERNIVVVLFVLVLVVFSFAERDTQRLIEFYNTRNTTEIKTPATNLIASEKEKPLLLPELR